MQLHIRIYKHPHRYLESLTYPYRYTHTYKDACKHPDICKFSPRDVFKSVQSSGLSACILRELCCSLEHVQAGEFPCEEDPRWRYHSLKDARMLKVVDMGGRTQQSVLHAQSCIPPAFWARSITTIDSATSLGCFSRYASRHVHGLHTASSGRCRRAA